MGNTNFELVEQVTIRGYDYGYRILRNISEKEKESDKI